MDQDEPSESLQSPGSDVSAAGAANVGPRSLLQEAVVRLKGPLLSRAVVENWLARKTLVVHTYIVNIGREGPSSSELGGCLGGGVLAKKNS